MRGFLEYVARQLVDQTGEMSLREEVRDGSNHYVLTLPVSEVGKVIGKQGHTIRAIRNLLGAASARHGSHCTFEVAEHPPVAV